MVDQRKGQPLRQVSPGDLVVGPRFVGCTMALVGRGALDCCAAVASYAVVLVAIVLVSISSAIADGLITAGKFGCALGTLGLAVGAVRRILFFSAVPSTDGVRSKSQTHHRSVARAAST